MEKKVLVVDDDPHILYCVKAVLEDIDPSYNVTRIGGGEECLEYLKTNRPDVILMDILMPGMDGWDVTAKIKEDEELQNIPLIFFTAKTDSVSKVLGKLISEDYIEKPFENQNLMDRIDAVISKFDIATP